MTERRDPEQVVLLFNLVLLFPATHCIRAYIKLACDLGLAWACFEDLADCFYFELASVTPTGRPHFNTSCYKL